MVVQLWILGVVRLDLYEWNGRQKYYKMQSSETKERANMSYLFLELEKDWACSFLKGERFF